MFDTVDGRNHATVDMVNTHYVRFHTSQVVVWDFFHQQWLDLMQSPLLKRLKLPGSHHSSWLFSTTRQGHFLHAPLHQQNKLAGDVCWYKVVPLLTGLHYCFLFDRYIHLLDANSRVFMTLQPAPGRLFSMYPLGSGTPASWQQPKNTPVFLDECSASHVRVHKVQLSSSGGHCSFQREWRLRKVKVHEHKHLI